MLGSIRLRAVTLTTNSWHPPVDAQSVLQYVTSIARFITSVEYVGFQGDIEDSLELQNGRKQDPWDKYNYEWFHVTARSEGSLPILEKLSEPEADALEVELLATQRD